MKTSFFILIILSPFAFSPVHTETMCFAGSDCVSLSDAEKILGEAVLLTENGNEEKDKVVRHHCTYTAAQPDATRKTGNLYYLLEEYPDVVAAQRIFSGSTQSNAGMPGQEKISGIGDEAFFQSDERNFHLMMVRKGNKIVRLKVNKVTGKTSLQALKEVVKNTALTL